MRKTFNDELKRLHVRFAELGMMVNEAVLRSTKAFVNHDRELAESVIKKDLVINNCENDLEKMTLELIALYQPVTEDLRDVITILKASSDIERIGDHAVSISQATVSMKGSQRIAEIEVETAKMSEYVCQMFQSVLDAYMKKSVERALKIARDDLFLDEELRKIRKRCVTIMQGDSELVVSGSYYTSVATYLERIGDYVTNVCEWIIFLKKGEIVELNPNARQY
ncbi:MAG: phosphate signaling complex protein PhoU [Liquorilactobacillus hordei]|uniref:Phosphate-specific transport system accessory protein PhoU n=3 Tax=Liquorilactobacillus hordei TaxID=468911 RepID=A0A0R1MML3_9LACO|nr:phosphate signaling complex protein PhoU [Liquorilactobacillus hordei]AUJ29268.1 phosphate transport system regulatory protein PhoU [Liquorilactobacillus hordei]KRL06645.1 phosphate transporter PhoU [Liquorilactobacillus hordei DSM 19519]MBZ2405485.1 phosphate transport system regulatory protein PhoU [Liquorilactobacillus hordei]QYH51986.1 phosphate signaling complex protein PhoU [Liquorilactobacillus hordei DSM 19519]